MALRRQRAHPYAATATAVRNQTHTESSGRLIAQSGPSTSDRELAAQLNARGMKTGFGRSFDVAAVKWVRYI